MKRSVFIKAARRIADGSDDRINHAFESLSFFYDINTGGEEMLFVQMFGGSSFGAEHRKNQLARSLELLLCAEMLRGI
jgi:hypothetical protein